MKKLTAIFLLAALMLGSFAGIGFLVSANSGGEYENTTPISALLAEGAAVEAGTVYGIATADDLFTFAELCTEANGWFAGATVALTADIDLNPGWTAGETAPVRVWTPIMLFSGTFDGQGHTLSGVYALGVTGWNANNATEEACGVFAAIGGPGVTVKNVNLTNSYFKAAKYAGSIVGVFSNGTDNTGGLISGVTSDATVISTVNYAGGIVSAIFNKISNASSVITIEDCVFSGRVTAENNESAGIVATSWRPLVIRNCVNRGMVMSAETGNVTLGGIAGTLQGGTLTMTGCVNQAGISTDRTVKALRMGGLVAWSKVDVTLENCVNAGSIMAYRSPEIAASSASDSSVGGLIGVADNNATVTLTECVNVGNVGYEKNSSNSVNESGVAVGGLVGRMAGSKTMSAVDCTSAGELLGGRMCVGGLVGAYSVAGGSFTRCIYTAVFEGGADYYSGGFIGQFNFSTAGNAELLTFTDCAYVAQKFTDYAQGRSMTLYATGTYATGATTRNIKAADTAGQQEVTLMGATITGSAWEKNMAINVPFTTVGCAKENLTGDAAKDALPAFDFTEAWALTPKGIPVPADTLALIPQGDRPALDAEVIAGSVDTENRVITETVTGAYYTVRIRTENNNTLTVYRDAELTEEISNPVRLVNGENTFWFVIRTADGSESQTWTANITTSGIDPLDANPDTDLRYYGRTYSSGTTRYMNWTASGFTFSFKGSGASATFVSEVKDGNARSYLKVYVDGKPTKKLLLDSTAEPQTFDLASGLDTDLPHTVSVYMTSDNAKSAIVGLTNVHLTDGEYLDPQPVAEKKVEIIGDSISVGYGNLGSKPSDPWTTAQQDGTLTYAALAAQAFGADYNVVALSGRGVAMNYGGGTSGTVPSVYDYTDSIHNGAAEWDFASWQPDVIVINLGTNDAGNASLSSETFRSACRDFLQNVRQKNPNAYIIYAYGFMNEKLSDEIQAVIAEMIEAGDSKISYLPLEILASDEKASANHPTLAAHADRAEVLIDAITEAMGWEALVTVAELLAGQEDLPIDTGSAGEDPDDPGGTVTLPGSFDPDHVITGSGQPGSSTDEPTGEPTGEPSDDSTAPPDTKATPPDESGCSSAITGLSLMLLLAAAGVAIAVCRKKAGRT